MSTMIVTADAGGPTISRHIYGHFAEHLGRCIYEGIWSVGNENWGCGGNMRAGYYADEFRRYATYCRNFSGRRLYKVACGGGDDWNETLLREALGTDPTCQMHTAQTQNTKPRNGSVSGGGLIQGSAARHSRRHIAVGAGGRRAAEPCRDGCDCSWWKRERGIHHEGTKDTKEM